MEEIKSVHMEKRDRLVHKARVGSGCFSAFMGLALTAAGVACLIWLLMLRK